MAVDISLYRVDQPGTSPRRRKLTLLGSYSDRGDVLAEACAATSLPMMVRVKPYGSLVLLPGDMEQFVDELRELQLEPSAKAEILALARACAADQNTELHLDGD
ncbi:hypothetical protein [Promicromonospora sp. NPDC050249]|uniref:hypothetical protein n=1 Tax=Promicromonospora sp. NPDC050249 TaxID=3154743 RepID=UPI0033C6615E